MKTKSHNVSPSIVVLLGVSTWPELEKFLSFDVSAAGIANMKRATFLIIGNCFVPMINEKYFIRESTNPNWIIRENFSSEILKFMRNLLPARCPPGKFSARPMPVRKMTARWSARKILARPDILPSGRSPSPKNVETYLGTNPTSIGGFHISKKNIWIISQFERRANFHIKIWSWNLLFIYWEMIQKFFLFFWNTEHASPL